MRTRRARHADERPALARHAGDQSSLECHDALHPCFDRLDDLTTCFCAFDGCCWALRLDTDGPFYRAAFASAAEGRRMHPLASSMRSHGMRMQDCQPDLLSGSSAGARVWPAAGSFRSSRWSRLSCLRLEAEPSAKFSSVSFERSEEDGAISCNLPQSCRCNILNAKAFRQADELTACLTRASFCSLQWAFFGWLIATLLGQEAARVVYTAPSSLLVDPLLNAVFAGAHITFGVAITMKVPLPREHSQIAASLARVLARTSAGEQQSAIAGCDG